MGSCHRERKWQVPCVSRLSCSLGGSVWECHSEYKCRHFHLLCTLLYLCLLPVYNCKEDTQFPSPLKRRLSQIFFFLFFRGWRWWRDGGAKSTGWLGDGKSRPEAGSERRYLKNEKDFVTALKDWILQVVILIGSLHYWEHCEIETVTSFIDSKPYEWHKSRKIYLSDPAGRSEKLVKGARLWLFRRSYMSL